jgi:hypothetical protein
MNRPSPDSPGNEALTPTSFGATRDDVRRLLWVLALVWLALAAFTTLAQRYLGWRLAIGLIGGAGALFSLGLALVAAGSFAVASVADWRAARLKREGREGREDADRPRVHPPEH